MLEKQLETLLNSGMKWLKPKHKNDFRQVLLDVQNHRCKICDKDLLNEKNTNRSLDHDHKNKFIRGVLCATCNMTLGKIERAGYSKNWMLAASEYLSENTGVLYPEKITAKRKTKKVEMKDLIDKNSWTP